jgi:site-specific DNA-methyltransferase (adenine-specific)
MSLYYQDDFVTLYHGDCREVMAGMADCSVSAVITDPPYSENTHQMAKSNKGKGHGVKAIEFKSFTEEDLFTTLVECGRVSERWVIANLDYKHAFKIDSEPLPGLRVMRIGVWVKTNPMPQISADRPGQGWEAIAYLHKDGVKPAWHGGGKHGNYILPTAQNEGHPTSKPLPMVSEWVRHFTDHGDTILDPFAGSGTTLRAAVDNGRKAIGVELDEGYCELIAKRLSQGALDIFGGAA